jgi:hypothetical protein
LRPGRSGGPSLSTWGSVRRWEDATRERLRRHHALWLHGWCIGLVVVAVMWGMAHLQLLAGSDSLAMRYLVTLGAGYIAFLFILRWWAGQLVGEQGHLDGNLDLGSPRAEAPGNCGGDTVPGIEPGGGGDFGGGGAEASFDDLVPDAGSPIADVASSALEVAGGADEGAVVVIPVVVVFLAGLLVVFGFGSLLLLYFGWEVLLTVAVEIAFGYVSGRTAVRLAREGWLNAAVRLTWKPLAGALACAVLLGALVDGFLPQARSLPHAVQLLRQSN